MYHNLFNKYMQNFRGELFGLCVAFNQPKKTIDINFMIITRFNRFLQFSRARYQLFLLLLISGAHFGKTFICQFAVYHILVQTLDDHINFNYPLLLLFKLTFDCRLPLHLFSEHIASDFLDKFIFKVTSIRNDMA